MQLQISKNKLPKVIAILKSQNIKCKISIDYLGGGSITVVDSNENKNRYIVKDYGSKIRIIGYLSGKSPFRNYDTLLNQPSQESLEILHRVLGHLID